MTASATSPAMAPAPVVMTRPMPERGDLIWIFEHEVMATAGAFLASVFLARPAPSSRPPKCASVQLRCRSDGKQLPTECIFYFGGPE